MGTTADDGAMPRASGNGCVVGSSITSGEQSGSWKQSKDEVSQKLKKDKAQKREKCQS